MGFYLVFALVSLPAYGLIVHDDDDDAAQRAGGVYMAFTVLGEAFLLMGFVLLAAGEPSDSLQIRDVVAALPQSPWRDAALAFTIAGFALKIGTVPAHGWMPLAYAAAPIPAASVLSGAAVKAGAIGLIRFLPFDTAMPGAGETLVALGFFSAFYGVAIGITQANPKTVLAYSSVSQMGVIAAVLGMGLTAGDQGVALDAAFYAATHVLAKGALFLAVGVVAVTAARRLRPTLLLAAVLALGLGGLPLTGGALAKLAVKAPLGDGVVGLLANVSAVGTTLLMLHFLQRLTQITPQDRQASAPAGLALPWQAMALASIVVPWLLYPFAGSDVADALTPNVLFDALWPVLVGAALALALRRWGIACRLSPRRHCRSGRESLPRELRRRRRVGASGRAASAMACSGPVVAGDCHRARHGGSVRPLNHPYGRSTSDDPLSSALRHSGCSIWLLCFGRRPAQ